MKGVHPRLICLILVSGSYCKYRMPRGRIGLVHTLLGFTTRGRTDQGIGSPLPAGLDGLRVELRFSRVKRPGAANLITYEGSGPIIAEHNDDKSVTDLPAPKVGEATTRIAR